MKLTGVHLLLSYQCTLECDHCFVWGSPRQTGTMTLRTIRHVLDEALSLGTVDWIYFEGGEPLLFHPVLVAGVDEATERGFRVGLVSNAYWATSPEDAETWLWPLSGKVQELSLSSDLYHSGDRLSAEARHARAAAETLGIPVGVICVAPPEDSARAVTGQLPQDDVAVMFRGRAARELAPKVARRPWTEFRECPHEELREPDRVHVDPLGHVHLCQGISLGSIFISTLREICEEYEPATHPITGPLLDGGPAELARRHERELALAPDGYADACHLCDAARRALRPLYPEVLTPDQMYGVPDAG